MSLSRAPEKKLAKKLIEWEKDLPPKNGFLHVESVVPHFLKDYVDFLQEHGFEIVSFVYLESIEILVSFR